MGILMRHKKDGLLVKPIIGSELQEQEKCSNYIPRLPTFEFGG